LKTVIVERGIVVIEPSGQIKVEPPATNGAGKPRIFPASEGEFFDQMEQRRPGVPAQLKSFIEELIDLGISPKFKRSLVSRW
jgi:hypothetical protein